MSTQYDFNPGLDLSSLSSATLAQIVQAISQITPLSNIGGIICSAGNAVGKTGHPDVINNPRFIRYIWLDIEDPALPVFKRYTGNRSVPVDNYDLWVTEGVAAGSITTAMLASPVGANNGVHIDLLKRNAAGSQVPADASKILRLDSNGQYIGIVAPADIYANGEIALAKLSPTGGLAYYVLQNNAGSISWTQLSYLNFANGGITLAKLFPGSAYQIPQVNAGATAYEAAYPKILQRVRTVKTANQDISDSYDFDVATSALVSDLTAISGLSQAITTLVASSYLRIRASVEVYVASNARIILGLSIDGVNIIASSCEYVGASNWRRITLDHLVASGGISTITAALYLASSAGTQVRINSTSAGANLQAGIAASFIEVEEVI